MRLIDVIHILLEPWSSIDIAADNIGVKGDN
jgi:hypothetical protein